MSVSGLFYCARASPAEVAGVDHPTVKPLALMHWLVKLVTPPEKLVVDPFAGSGTTGVAALRAGRRFAGSEREPKYAETAARRLREAEAEFAKEGESA